MVEDRPHEAEILRLRRLALRDDLTGLANRRAFLQRLDTEIQRARTGAAPFMLILLDLDGLKDLNDTFGHQAGDAALRAFGRALRRAVRADDLVARIGGDEFVVVAAPGSAEDATVFAARIEAVAAGLILRVTAGGQPVLLSAAMGAALWDARDSDAESLFTRAETALLASKHGAAGQDLPPSEVYQPRGRRALGDELRRLLASARRVSSAHELHDLGRTAAEHAAALIGARAAAIALPRADGLTGYDEHFVDGAWVHVAGRWYERGRGVIGQVMETAEPHVIGSVLFDSLDEPAATASLGTESAMALPLRDPAGDALGVLSLTHKRGGRDFSQGDVQLGMAFADLVASAIENVRAREQEETAHRYVRSLMEQAHDAIYIIDPATRRILDVNQAAERISGYTREQLLQMLTPDLHPPEDRSLPDVSETVPGDQPVQAAPYRHLRADGTVIPVEVSAQRVRTPSGDVVMNTVRDVSHRVAVEEELRHRNRELEARNDVAALLAGADDDVTALRGVLRAVVETVGSDGALLAQYDPETGSIRVAVDYHMPPDVRAYFAPRVSRPSDGIRGIALPDRLVVVPDTERIAPDAARVRPFGVRSYAIVPMIGRGRVVGVMASASHEPNRFDEAAVALLRAVADQSALWLENHCLLAESQQRERDARFLSELSDVLNRAGDLDQVVRRLARKSGDALETAVAVGLLEGTEDRWQTTYVAHSNTSRRRRLKALLDATPPRTRDGLIARAARAGASELFITDDPQLPPGAAAALRESGLAGVLICPLRVGRRTIGVLAAGTGPGEPPFTQRHIALAAGIARQAAVAFANFTARRGLPARNRTITVLPRRDAAQPGGG